MSWCFIGCAVGSSSGDQSGSSFRDAAACAASSCLLTLAKAPTCRASELLGKGGVKAVPSGRVGTAAAKGDTNRCTPPLARFVVADAVTAESKERRNEGLMATRCGTVATTSSSSSSSSSPSSHGLLVGSTAQPTQTIHASQLSVETSSFRDAKYVSVPTSRNTRRAASLTTYYMPYL